VWDETRVLAGSAIGEAARSRAQRDSWFVGVLTAPGAALRLALDFLAAGATCDAGARRPGDSAALELEERRLTRDGWTCPCAPGGGFVARFTSSRSMLRSTASSRGDRGRLGHRHGIATLFARQGARGAAGPGRTGRAATARRSVPGGHAEAFRCTSPRAEVRPRSGLAPASGLDVLVNKPRRTWDVQSTRRDFERIFAST